MSFCPHCHTDLKGTPDRCPYCTGVLKPLVTGENYKGIERACKICGVIGAIGFPLLLSGVASWWILAIGGGFLGYAIPGLLLSLAPREKG